MILLAIILNGILFSNVFERTKQTLSFHAAMYQGTLFSIFPVICGVPLIKEITPPLLQLLAYPGKYC